MKFHDSAFSLRHQSMPLLFEEVRKKIKLRIVALIKHVK